ncbi:F-box/LRR-repeat protein At2g40920-like [Brassica rapa]|uniref:F-box domain-containing protein n=1 Tax=Brassica campestris TaxID=3711 RepID=M4EPW6_BRACM|nr:F-box/LRR-repeat protein At2g40920-like [Brassica rapa]
MGPCRPCRLRGSYGAHGTYSLRRPNRPYGRPNIKRKIIRRLPEMEMEMRIPMHVVTEEVLTRMPAKSLMRFKCVSKLWSSLISSPYFKDRFLTVPTRQRPHLFMCLQDVNDHSSSVPDANSDDTPSSSSSFVVDHTIPRMRGGYICQNLRGFMCYDLWQKPRIFNPATRQLVTLPPAFNPNTTKGTVSYYFGHDPITDQYKVVCSVGVRLTDHRVFVLKPGGGGSWRKAYRLPPPDFIPHIAARGGVCINGVIYYLGWTAADSCMLVTFHIRSHDFKMIQVPLPEELPPPAKMKNVCLVEYGGKVTVVDQASLRDKGRLDLWALEDAANQKWSSKRLVVKPSQLDFVRNTEFVVRGTSRNGKVFLIPTDLVSPFQILCYDLQSNHMRKIDIKGVPDHWFSKDKSTVEVMLMDHSETLMSLMNT